MAPERAAAPDLLDRHRIDRLSPPAGSVETVLPHDLFRPAALAIRSARTAAEPVPGRRSARAVDWGLGSPPRRHQLGSRLLARRAQPCASAPHPRSEERRVGKGWRTG